MYKQNVSSDAIIQNVYSRRVMSVTGETTVGITATNTRSAVSLNSVS